MGHTAQINDDWDIELNVNGVPVVYKINLGAHITLVTLTFNVLIVLVTSIYKNLTNVWFGQINCHCLSFEFFNAILVNKDRSWVTQKM